MKVKMEMKMEAKTKSKMKMKLNIIIITSTSIESLDDLTFSSVHNRRCATDIKFKPIM